MRRDNGCPQFCALHFFKMTWNLVIEGPFVENELCLMDAPMSTVSTDDVQWVQWVYWPYWWCSVSSMCSMCSMSILNLLMMIVSTHWVFQWLWPTLKYVQTKLHSGSDSWGSVYLTQVKGNSTLFSNCLSLFIATYINNEYLCRVQSIWSWKIVLSFKFIQLLDTYCSTYP